MQLSNRLIIWQQRNAETGQQELQMMFMLPQLVDWIMAGVKLSRGMVVPIKVATDCIVAVWTSVKMLNACLHYFSSLCLYTVTSSYLTSHGFYNISKQFTAVPPA